MTSHVDQTERVRSLALRQMQESGATATSLQETILIREGQYCGRRFRADGFQAVWFIEENELKIYGPDAGILCVLRPLDMPSTEERRVA